VLCRLVNSNSHRRFNGFDGQHITQRPYQPTIQESEKWYLRIEKNIFIH
jgi:hypothetical protein